MDSVSDKPAGTTAGTTVIALVAAAVGSGHARTAANLGLLLAAAGRRVLIVDWSSERPSVHHYLRRFVAEPMPAPDDDPFLIELTELVEPAAVGGTPVAHRSLAVERFRYGGPYLPVPIDLLCNGPADDPPAVQLSGLTPSAAARVRAKLHADGDNDHALRMLPATSLLSGQATSTAARVRAMLRDGDHDHVLLVLPATSDPAGATTVARLCDVAVVGFAPDQLAAGAAAELAIRLRAASTQPIRLVAAPSTRYGGSAPEAPRELSRIRRPFSDLLFGGDGRAAELTMAELPDWQYHDQYPILTTLVDPPGQEQPIAAAYQRLVKAVGASPAGDITLAGIVGRYRLAFQLAAPGPTDLVLLAYAPRDRPWADWVAEQLRLGGVRIERLRQDSAPADGSTVVFVSSRRFAGSAARRSLLLVAGGPQAAQRLHTVAVRIDDTELPPLTHCEVVDLRTADPGTARRDLLAAARVFEGRDASAPEVRFPAPEQSPGGGAADGGTPDKAGVPRPNPRFVGRAWHLDELRDRLCPLDGGADDRLSRVVLDGPSGMGKSEIARDYANRFGVQYEFVWWLPAGDRQSVRDRLADLADRCDLPRSGDPVAAVLEHLSSRTGDLRWLLVYDNATDETIDRLLPVRGAGDVIITSSQALTTVLDTPISIGGLDPDDSLQLLRGGEIGLPELPAELASEIAATLRHAPVALQLAVTRLAQRAAYLRRGQPTATATAHAARELLDQLGQDEPGGAEAGVDCPDELSTIHRMLGLTIDTLIETRIGRVAVALARLCVFVSPDGIRLSVLRSRTALAALATASGDDGDILLADEAELDRVLWTGTLLGLFDVDHGQPATLRMHRVLQQTLLTMMDQEQRYVAQAQALRSLAGFGPPEPEADQHGAELAELHRHLSAAGVVDADYAALQPWLGSATEPGTEAWAVRRWLVGQVRYLFQLRNPASWAAAVHLGDHLDKAWTDAFGAADPLVGRLAAQRANVLREQSRYQEALDLDRPLLVTQRATLDRRHPRALMTARGLAGDLRRLGRFDEALAEDQATWRGFVDTFGPDHPQTLMAAFNLAQSMLLMGQVHEARRLEETSHHRRLRVFGEDHPWVWESRSSLSILHAAVGEYEQALALIDDNLRRMRRRHQRAEHSEQLHAMRIQLTIERRAGNRRPPRWISDDAEDLVALHRRRFGPTHDRTRAAELSWAVDLHVAGDPDRAELLGEACLDAYAAQFGESHPYSGACRNNLMLFRRGRGRLEQAAEDGQRALTDLRNRLDELHPWTLVAAVNHACTLALTDRDAAAELLHQTVLDCDTYLGATHPTTVAAEHNLEVVGDPSPVSGRWRELDLELN